MIRFLLSLISLTVACSASADSVGMYDVEKAALVHSYIDLQAKGQEWYIFHNDSLQTVWLNAIIKHPSASAGWSSKLQGQKYSLLALSDKELFFSCNIQEGDKFRIVPCNRYLHISSVLSSTVNGTQAGSFWVAEDVPLDDLKRLAAKRDILLNY